MVLILVAESIYFGGMVYRTGVEKIVQKETYVKHFRLWGPDSLTTP